MRGRSHDQADDKLGQLGPVSGLEKPAQVVPPSAGGGRGREGGVRAAARELGISRTDARRAVHRVHRIAPAVREALRDMPEIADNGAELDALATLPAEQQVDDGTRHGVAGDAPGFNHYEKFRCRVAAGAAASNNRLKLRL